MWSVSKYGECVSVVCVNVECESASIVIKRVHICTFFFLIVYLSSVSIGTSSFMDVAEDTFGGIS